ncbi:dihydrofolate reductase [Hymenobacter sp. RP-2-7]|uniref:Dihydrofolate reductase n=1 Tax=Hymenobacter polaris TaxID=2682546 RepID=A0A7Y0ADL0_9BACT|nr:dihydrofolate reductase [Hymenobacter polaris]NML65377.1 dihydrofolate reductase [Hymenobacter polaris]
MIALVVAVADGNNVIGRAGELPWGRLPADLRHFKQLTLGHPVVMGRKTFDSIGRALPGRPNLVITRQPSWEAAGTEAYPTVAAALARARELAGAEGVVCIIGGGEIYREALPAADLVYLTEVHGTFAGDTFFPTLAPAQWREETRERHEADDQNPHAYSFVTLRRR